MKTVFADTHFWVALIHRGDEHHDIVTRISQSLEDTQVLTTQMVLAEFLNFFSGLSLAYKAAAAELVDSIVANTDAEVVAQSATQFDAAFDVYKGFADKEWALTDCASFNVMRERDVTEALTHDHHFEQMGFRALLRGQPG